jgi:hypothetical protein
MTQLRTNAMMLMSQIQLGQKTLEQFSMGSQIGCEKNRIRDRKENLDASEAQGESTIRLRARPSQAASLAG